MAIKGFEILLWFLIIPLAAGNLPVFETGKEKDWFVRMADALICGYVLLFAVFELLALPLIFTRQSFAVLKYSYEILACVLALAGVIFAWKNKKNRADGAERKKSLSRKKIPAAMWLAFLLVAIQMGSYVFGMATDLDDAFYVATATTTLETNGMFTYDAYTGMLASYLPARYVFAPFPILLAFYSDMVHMHAAVVAHTVEPVFFLLISYLVYWKIGRKLFDKDDRKVGLFLLFLALIQMFSYYSVYTQGTFLSIRIWQGKALLASFVLPAIFLQAKECMETNRMCGAWVTLFLMMTSACLVSGMGIMLAPIMLGLMTLLYAVKDRNWGNIKRAVICCLPNVICAAAYARRKGRIMITAFQIAIERAGWYIGSGWHYLLFAAALLFLILKRDDKENRKWLVGYTLLFAAVYICPLTARIIMKYCIGGFVYWRMFWILPTSVIVAYVAVSVCTAGKKKTIQAVCASLLMALIIVTGKNPYVGGQAIYQKAVNMQKLPADACQISELIAATRAEGETALAVMPEDLVGYVRQYDASIRLLYGRRSKSEKPVRKIRRQMRKEQPKIKKLIRRIRQQGVNYLVFLADDQQDTKIQRNGFEKIGKVGGYSVYKDKW